MSEVEKLVERLREMAKWRLEGFADHITLIEAADALAALHDTHGAKRVSAPDMVQTSPDGLTEAQHSAGECSTCGGVGFIERASGPEQRWACPECTGRARGR